MTDADRPISEALHSLLAELIAIPSVTPPGDTQAICEAAGEHFRSAGYEVSMPMRTPPIANLVARLGEGSPCVVFNSHIDTVGTGDRAAWAHRPLRRDAGEGPHQRAGSQQLQGLGGGSPVACRRGRAAGRARAGQRGLRARRRRGAPGIRGHRVPARGRTDRARRPGARLAHGEPHHRRGARHPLARDRGRRPRRPWRRSAGGRQRHPPHDAPAGEAPVQSSDRGSPQGAAGRRSRP